jgi:hypothetical protein
MILHNDIENVMFWDKHLGVNHTCDKKTALLLKKTNYYVRHEAFSKLKSDIIHILNNEYPLRCICNNFWSNSNLNFSLDEQFSFNQMINTLRLFVEFQEYRLVLEVGSSLFIS